MASKRTTISFPEEMYDEIKEMAEIERRSISSFIQIVMEKHLSDGKLTKSKPVKSKRKKVIRRKK